MVADVDKHVMLTEEQRAALTALVDDAWDEAWTPNVENFLHGSETIPPLPNDREVRNVLTPEQRKQYYTSVRRVNAVFTAPALHLNGPVAGFGGVEEFEVIIDE